MLPFKLTCTALVDGASIALDQRPRAGERMTVILGGNRTLPGGTGRVITPGEVPGARITLGPTRQLGGAA